MAGGVLAPSQNGGTMKVGKSPDAAGGQLTPTPANLQNPDVSCGILSISSVHIAMLCHAIDLAAQNNTCHNPQAS